MTPGEIYDIKRNNFIDKSKVIFNFLVKDNNFNIPKHLINKQQNNTVTRDSFVYEGKSVILIISNSYHPNDYGFEVNIKNKTNLKTEMIYFVLKEKQNAEQDYLYEAAEFLKDYFNGV